MTVAELIEELSKLENQDARAVVRGCEGGVDDIYGIEFMKIALDVNKDKWYCGNHEEIYGPGDTCTQNSTLYPCVPAYKIG